jgi:hypothetical protein
MWKAIVAVVAVFALAAAGFLFWDGHQAGEDARAARADAKNANAKAQSLDDQTKAVNAKARTANARVETINHAAGDLTTDAGSVGLNLDNAAKPQGDIVATINPIVDQAPSAAARAHLADDLRQVDQALVAADNANSNLRRTAAALEKAAR